MTATSEKAKLNGSRSTEELRAPTRVVPPGRRRPAFVVAGVAMVVIGALATVWLVSSVGHRVDVVVMAKDVPYGSALSSADLTTTAVSVDRTVATVPASSAATLVGQVATTNLRRGSLLTRGEVTSTGVVAVDEVSVPMPLPPERVPAGGLSAGEQLLIVDTPAAGADPVAVAPRTFAARVVRVGAPDINGLVVVDVATKSKEGPALATRAATARFALVVLPMGASK
ncbi:SAF domain-containing protein [Cellulomonas sp. URHD0024]|uniref:SAF domain-containing protein n=1 Tax=Cellulomonas sp. URHD0024 TaxID=1302620 RepID=UPI0009DBAB73|nr:SAF domain-containing protein [Cellulomonas sp. URHD0024]